MGVLGGHARYGEGEHEDAGRGERRQPRRRQRCAAGLGRQPDERGGRAGEGHRAEDRGQQVLGAHLLDVAEQVDERDADGAGQQPGADGHGAEGDAGGGDGPGGAGEGDGGPAQLHGGRDGEEQGQALVGVVAAGGGGVHEAGAGRGERGDEEGGAVGRRVPVGRAP